MTTRGSIFRVVLPTALTLPLALALYLPRRAPTITTRFGGTDGGELVAVALSGGVAHPGGYPSYLLLARLMLALPWGEPAARVALLSALAGALAAALTAALPGVARSSDMRPIALAAVPGLFAGLSFALGARFWSQAIIVEVYALHVCWLVLCALLLHIWLRSARAKWLLGAALALGFGMGTHLTLLMVLPAGLLAWWLALQRSRIPWRLTLAATALWGLGLAVYALLPLWDRRGAVPSWGATGSLSGWWAHVSGAEYRYLVGIVPWNERLSRISFAVRDLLRQPGPLAVVLALGWGWTAGWEERRSLTAFAAVVALLSLGFAVSYGAADGEVYLLPWTWAWCLASGLGLEQVMRAVGRLPRPWATGSALLLAVGLGGSLVGHYAAGRSDLDLHADVRERERVVALLAAAPRGALLASRRDADTFGVWYAQRALGVRPDVLVVETRLLHRPWYRRQLAQQLDPAHNEGLCALLMAGQRPTVEIGEAELRPVSAETWANSAACATSEP